MSDSTADPPDAGSVTSPNGAKQARAETKPASAAGKAGPAAGKRASGAGGAPAVAAPPLPSTVKLVFAAMAVQALAIAVRVIGLRGSTATLEQWLVSTNAKAKKPKTPYDLTSVKGLAAVQSDLHALRTSALYQAVLTLVVLAVLFVLMRRARSANPAKWGLVVITVLSFSPAYIIPTPGWPAMPKYASVLFGLASVVAVILLFMPRSAQYFRECRALARPGGAGGRPGTGGSPGAGGRPGAARPSLRDLFLPRGTAGTRTPPPRAPARQATTPGAPANPSAAKAKAKVRSEEAAVAKGAQLARSRAKASKSRRTEP